MSRVIELAAGEEASIFVEIDESRMQGTQRIAAENAERVLEKVTGTFEGALANIHKVASGLYDTIRRLPRAPDTAKVEFGVKLTGGAGIIIASGSAAANIKITLDWRASEARTGLLAKGMTPKIITTGPPPRLRRTPNSIAR
jgi:hypothetical protein